MATKVDCPRCKLALAVPAKMAGGYAVCPRCQGRFWVPKEAGIEVPAAGASALPPPGGSGIAAGGSGIAPGGSGIAPGGSGIAAGGSGIVSSPRRATPPVPSATPPVPMVPRATPPVATPPVATPPVASPPAANLPTVTTSPNGPPLAPPIVMPVRGRKVARLISSEAAQSPLRLAADGMLPQLQLEEGESPEKDAKGKRAMHPAVLAGVIAMSLVLTVLVLLSDRNAPAPTSMGEKSEARRILTEEYFGAGHLDRAKLQPYQELLRLAEQAHARGDSRGERENYRKVLALLRSEPNQRGATGAGEHGRGVTGSVARDRLLEEQISILLREN